jgi:putative SOS response-associated peptidase YedK
MCGRYYRRADKQRIAECFAANPAPDLTDLVPDYNVAPTTFQPVIRNSRDGAVRELLLMRWGLVPFFAKSLADFKGFSTFNAKAESVTTQATWREPFKRGRRCLVPADGYFEWGALGPKEKQPYAFTVGEDSTFAFAGLWDAWHDKKTDQWLQSFAILTTSSNELTRAVHPRMPVILHERDYDEWLLRDDGPPPMHLLQSFPAAEMRVRPVSRDVGNVKNNHPELLNSK